MMVEVGIATDTYACRDASLALTVQHCCYDCSPKSHILDEQLRRALWHVLKMTSRKLSSIRMGCFIHHPDRQP